MATTTCGPLDKPKEVTEADSAPAEGCVAKTTVSDVAEADEIEATVPLLRATTLPAAAGSKLKPLMTSEVAVVYMVAELVVTMGAGGSGAAETMKLWAQRPTVLERGAHLAPILVTM